MSIPRNLSIIADTLNSDGTFASISNTGSTTLSSGTANGVAYLNGSKVLTTGSALSFDGTNFATTGTASAAKLIPTGTSVTGNGMYLPATNSVGISTAGTNAVYIDASQNVGIGTNSPAVRLEVRGADAAARFRGSSTQFLDVVATAGGTVKLDANNGDLAFAVNTTEQMRLTSTGLGIGTSSPVYQTQIYGSGQTTAALTDAGNKGGSLLLNTPTVAAGDGGALLIGAGGSGAKPYAAIKGLLADGAGNTTGNLAFSTRNATADTALTERMRIDSSGNVGIGTSSPSASAILDAQSTTKGVRMPNMTTTQKNAISSPAAGLMVFDTTLAKLCVYSGSAWQTVTSI